MRNNMFYADSLDYFGMIAATFHVMKTFIPQQMRYFENGSSNSRLWEDCEKETTIE